jgi:hypothetical protein
MKKAINTATTTGIFYRDEMGNPLCPRCVEEQYPHNHGLEMEVVDEDEPVECDGCGEEIH